MMKQFKRLLFILLASIGSLLLITLGLVVFSVVAINANTEAEASADTASMAALIRHNLVRGATFAHALVILRSPAITAFRRTHGFADSGDGFYIDTAFVRVSAFDPYSDQAQAYPQGKAALVVLEHYSGMKQVGWGITRSDHKRLYVWLFFDRVGRYTHCQVDEVFPALPF